MQRNADLWEIDQLEKNFHKATTKKNIDLMMSLYAPNATFTFPGSIAVGKKQIRQFWLTKSKAFMPENDWISETPAYKVRITVNGDRGTLYFECVYVDAKTGEIESRHGRRRRRCEDRRALADHEPGGSVRDAQTLRPCPRRGHAPERAAPAGDGGRCPDPSDNRPRPRVSAACRRRSTPSCSSRSSAPPLLVVAVGLLGLRVLGQSNDRAGEARTLQERALAYGKLESQTRGPSACSSTRIPGPDFYEVNPAIVPRRSREERRLRSTRRSQTRSSESAPRRVRSASASCLPPEDRLVLRDIRAKSERLSTVIERIVDVPIRGASDEEQKPLRNQAHRLATDLYQTAADLAIATTVATEALIAAERELVREPAQPVHRRRRGGRSSSRCFWASSSPGR